MKGGAHGRRGRGLGAAAEERMAGRGRRGAGPVGGRRGLGLRAYQAGSILSTGIRRGSAGSGPGSGGELHRGLSPVAYPAATSFRLRCSSQSITETGGCWQGRDFRLCPPGRKRLPATVALGTRRGSELETRADSSGTALPVLFAPPPPRPVRPGRLPLPLRQAGRGWASGLVSERMVLRVRQGLGPPAIRNADTEMRA